MATKKRSQSLIVQDIKSDSVSSSEEEYHNDIIKNMYIKFENTRSEQVIAHPKDLEYYNKLYECKQKLSEKNVIFYINDKDLIELNNDKSNVLYLRIIKGSQEIQKEKNSSKENPIQKNTSEQYNDNPPKSPKDIKPSHSPKNGMRSRSNSGKDKDAITIKKNPPNVMLSLSDGEDTKTNNV